MTDQPNRVPRTRCPCGAVIVWAKTEAGRTMPVDVKATHKGNLRLVLEGDELRAYVAKPHDEPGKRFLSHFVTCPDAGNYRRPKK